MRFAQYSLMVAACLMLLSCASPKMSQELEGGKSAFQSGDYKQAFHQLLPVAVSGRPEAQYAVGYMYYYGYGVAEDTESGIFWMEKSAQQNYPPAIRALNLIHQPIESERREVYKAPQNEQDAVLESLHQHQLHPAPVVPLHPAHPVQHLTPSYPSMNDDSGDDGDDLDDDVDESLSSPVLPPHASHVTHKKQASVQKLSVAPVKQFTKNDFTMQLFGAYKLNAVKGLQAQLNLKDASHIWHTTHNGKDWYVLTYGKFVTSHQAYVAKKQLPSSLHEFTPWVRNVDGLQLV